MFSVISSYNLSCTPECNANSYRINSIALETVSKVSFSIARTWASISSSSRCLFVVFPSLSFVEACTVASWWRRHSSPWLVLLFWNDIEMVHSVDSVDMFPSLSFVCDLRSWWLSLCFVVWCCLAFFGLANILLIWWDVCFTLDVFFNCACICCVLMSWFNRIICGDGLAPVKCTVAHWMHTLSVDTKLCSWGSPFVIFWQALWCKLVIVGMDFLPQPHTHIWFL